MAYKYDVFISYKRGRIINPWIERYFLHRFEWELEGGIGRKPSIFYDVKDIEQGDSWQLRLKEILSSSVCLVPLLSPQYFQSTYCQAECLTMLKREQLLGYRTEGNQGKLVFPVVVNDGKFFPDYIKAIQQEDFSDYILEEFEGTLDHQTLQKKIRAFAGTVAEAILQQPQWQAAWQNEVLLEIPPYQPPVTQQPKL